MGMLEQSQYFVLLYCILGREASSRLFLGEENVVVEEGLRLLLALTVEDGRSGGVLRRWGCIQRMHRSREGLRHVWRSMIHDCENGCGDCGGDGG